MDEKITSRDNPKVKYACKLADSPGFRRSEGRFFAEVRKLCPELARGAALKVAGEEHIAPIRRSMGGEDFSAYTHIVPCAFVALGGGGEAPQHSEKFCIDESAFETGVAMYAQVAVDFLNG